MRLVIVESPKKARTIKGFLGPGYLVAASMGHVRDLPPKELGIDVQHDFAPAYEVLARARPALALLRKAAAGAESVLLATDPDREGEAIAWHLAEALRLPRSRYRRITFHEISRRALQEALASPRDLDSHLIDAQQARRVLDRLVGYQLSPLLWRKVQRGTSAGRVQSVAVKLVVDREREIMAFFPEEYWTINVALTTNVEGAARPVAGQAAGRVAGRARSGATIPEHQPGDAGDTTFLAQLQEVDGKKAEIGDAETAAALESQLRAAAYTVRETGQRNSTRNPFPPFTTSTLQQAAGNRLRYPAKKTMSAAQSLYEAGLVTYMRTDSVAVSSDAITQARQLIGAQFGAEYVPASPRRYATRTKNAQEAHEAIRPVDVQKTPASLRGTLSPEDWRIYDLIWKRMVASQMASARYLQDVAIIDGIYRSDQPEQARQFTLKAQATTLVFPGWLAAYGEDDAGSPGNSAVGTTQGGARSGGSSQRGAGSEDGQADAPENQKLPDLAAGQPLRAEDVFPAQHFTQPPRRYSEASLVKALEEAGVGRPSTYATVVSTIQDRSYVHLEQRHFVPTELGFATNDFLVAHFPRIVDLPFTAAMEDSLDEIAGGRTRWVEMLHAFYGPFAETLHQAGSASETALKQRERATGASSASPGVSTPGTPATFALGARRSAAARTRRATSGAASDSRGLGGLDRSDGAARPPRRRASTATASGSGDPDAASRPARRRPASATASDPGEVGAAARPTRRRSSTVPPGDPADSGAAVRPARRQRPAVATPPDPAGLGEAVRPARRRAPTVRLDDAAIADALWPDRIAAAPPDYARPLPLPESGAPAPSCPQCGRPLVQRTSQYGPFLGCSGFPACRYIQREADGAAARRPGRPPKSRGKPAASDPWAAGTSRATGGAPPASHTHRAEPGPDPLTKRVVRGGRANVRPPRSDDELPF